MVIYCKSTMPDSGGGRLMSPVKTGNPARRCYFAIGSHMNLSEETSPQSTDKKLVELRETRCTCSACGNVWYYGKEEVQKNNAA